MTDDKNNNWIKYATLLGIGAITAYRTYRASQDNSNGTNRQSSIRNNPLHLFNKALGKVSLKFPAKIPSDMLKEAETNVFLQGIVQHKRLSLKRCAIYYSIDGINKQLVGFLTPREASPNKWTIDSIYIDPKFRDKDIASQALILFFAKRQASEIDIDVNDVITHQIFGKAGFVHNPKVYVNNKTGLMYNKWHRNPYIAVIIKDAPSIVEGKFQQQADDFYNQIIEILDTRGYSILFDDGTPSNPLPNATVWIAHGNGEEKLHTEVAKSKKQDTDLIFISEYNNESELYQNELEKAAGERNIKINQLSTINRPIPSDGHFALSDELKITLRTL